MTQPNDWDAIDQASLDSFPASDPPARGGARAAPSKSTVSDTAPPSASAAISGNRLLQPRRLMQIGLGVLGGGALIGLVMWRMRARRGWRARWF